jgi:NTP pyrophosphatase (non-canonical NTP hydrolase)
MKKLEYLLTCLSEENGEVIQEVGKAIRFGLDDINPKILESNENAIHREMIDIIAVYLMIFPEHNLIGASNFSEVTLNQINAKQEKVKKWMKYSAEKGKINE